MTTLALFDTIGTLAFAYSGYLAGRRHGLDIMGLFIVAMLTATAGGALADVLLGRSPSVLTNRDAFLMVTGVVALGLILTRAGFGQVEDRWLFVLADAAGLVAFAIAGAHKAMDAELLYLGTVVIAFLSAVGGGIIRDTMTGELPSVLHSGLYGIIAFISCTLVWGTDWLGWQFSEDHWVLFVFCVGLRMVAHWRGWSLPKP